MMKRSTPTPASKFLTTTALEQVTGGETKPPYSLTFKWQPETIEYTKPSGTTTKP